MLSSNMKKLGISFKHYVIHQILIINPFRTKASVFRGYKMGIDDAFHTPFNYASKHYLYTLSKHIK